MYYLTSDGNIMELEDFISYAIYLSTTETSFSFTESFSQEDFSDVETFEYLEQIFNKCQKS